MKWAKRILIGVLGIYVLYRVAMFIFIAILFSRQKPPSFVDSLSTNPATYSNVDEIAEDDLVMHCYGLDQNQFVNALPNSKSKPNIADSAGNLSAFKWNGDIFVITFKWPTTSAGFAISNDPKFKTKIESIDNRLRVEHIRDNIYQWSLDFD